jgi:hypothetical protein
MSGSGTGGSANYSEPGWANNVLVPIMRAVGLGIAARGGALGPMLASGGDSIADYYQGKRDQATIGSLLKLMQPILRSESTPGLPARFSAEASAARAETPEATVPPDLPAVAGTRRDWMGDPTRAEIMARIAGPDVPETLRPWLTREVMDPRLRLPTDVQRRRSSSAAAKQKRKPGTRLTTKRLCAPDRRRPVPERWPTAASSPLPHTRHHLAS